jgi:hypothetical protein
VILRLLRLLVPVVLVVMCVFIAALPFQGLSEVFQTLSAGATMLAMVGAGVTLVSVTIDRDDGQATGSWWLARAARTLAAILVIPAGLACCAVWLRVADYGWTPERLFAALAAGIGLIYGLIYLFAVVRGTGWMGRLRQANIGMAGLVVLVAALWLTPVLNAERISANSQAARFAAGEMEISEISTWEFEKWGTAGAAFVTTLTAKAAEPGQEALAAALAVGEYGNIPSDVDQPTLIAALQEMMPLQPPSATSRRDQIMAGMSPYDLENLHDACARKMPNGKPGCVMVVTDLLPEPVGDEAVVYLYFDPTYGIVQGFVWDGTYTQSKTVYTYDPGSDHQARPMEMITALQAGPPKLTAVISHEITTAGVGLRMDPW